MESKDLLGVALIVDGADTIKSIVYPDAFKHPTGHWFCAGFTEATGEDLKVNQRIDFFVVEKVSGKIVDRHYWWPTTPEIAARDYWPKSLHLSMSALNFEKRWMAFGEPEPETSPNPAKSPQVYFNTTAAVPQTRIWYRETQNRAFHTSPHKQNWIKYLTFKQQTLSEGATIELSVLDRTTNSVFANYIFKPEATRLKPEHWHADICALINKESPFIRAGGCDVNDRIDQDSPGSTVWIPKNSEFRLQVSSNAPATETVPPDGNSQEDASHETAPPARALPAFKLPTGLTKVAETLLPDMTGFDPDMIGAPENCWLSPCYLLADRDLEVGETIHAWLIQRSDGEPLEHVTFTAQDGNCAKAQWPRAFATQLKADARHIRAGGWTENGEFTELEGSETANGFLKLDLIAKARLNQLWHYSQGNRVISTCPFRSNWVQALTLGGASLEANTTLWVQVRDITSQYLYETHIFQPSPKGMTSAQWTHDLCKQINESGKMLKAGCYDDASAMIASRDKENALWIPQCSDLAVTLMPVTWWTQQTVIAEQDLAEGDSIYTYVWDDFSSVELAAPHCFTPASAEERKKDKWVGAWAKSLNGSHLKPYVRLAGQSDPSATVSANATQAWLWQVGAPLKVFTTEPSPRNWVVKEFCMEQHAADAKNTMLLSVTDEENEKRAYQIRCNPYSLNTVFSDPWQKKIIASFRDQMMASNIHFIKINSSPPATNAKFTSGSDSDSVFISAVASAKLRTSFIPSKNITDEEQTAFEVIEELRKYKDYTASVPAQKRLTPAVLDYLNVPDATETAHNHECAAIVERALLSNKPRKTEKTPTPEILYFSMEGFITENIHPTLAGFLYTPPASNILEKLKEDKVLEDAEIALLDMLNETEKNLAIDALLRDEFTEGIITNHTGRAFQKLSDFIINSAFSENSVLAAIFRRLKKAKVPSRVWIEDTVIPDRNFSTGTVIKVEIHNATASSSSTTYQMDGLNSAKSTSTFRLSPSARAAGVRIITLKADSEAAELYRKELAFNDDAFEKFQHFCHRLELYAPSDFKSSDRSVVFRGVTNVHTIWESRTLIACRFPPNQEGPTPTSPLCEDYGNTYRSEVFDVTGQNSNGVDPRTGLFNAHCSLGVLAGVAGNGPFCDLTLHYSPLRANESGLGDGWAFNFSWYDSRPRLLTLNTGVTVQFTEPEILQLIAGEVLEKPMCSIRGVADVSKSLYKLEITHLSGEKELLAPPTGDTTEHNSDLVKYAIDAFEEAKRQIPLYIAKNTPADDTPWYEKALNALFVTTAVGVTTVVILEKESSEGSDAITAITHLSQTLQNENQTFLSGTRYKTALGEWRRYWRSRLPQLLTEIDREIAYWERPDHQLIPSQITSASGGTLTFDWIRREGQYLLSAVWGAHQLKLLSGDHGMPYTPPGSSDVCSDVTFTFAPDTDYAHRVTLSLKNYLLKSVTRCAMGTNEVLDRCEYRYSVDPTLDRVLTCITESDGSVEQVVYESDAMKFPKKGEVEKPPLPRVVSHVVSPGPDQPPLRTDWEYSVNNYLGFNESGDYSHLEDSAVKQGAAYLYWSTANEDKGIKTTRIWNGLHLQVEEQKITAAGSGTTVQWEFSDVDKTDPRFGLNTKTITLYQDQVEPSAQERAS